MSETVFLSTASAEFGNLRERLAGVLRRTHRVHVRHQADFVERGVLTLRKLVEEIQQSSLVVHVIGAMPGSAPPTEQVEEVLGLPELAKFAERYPEVVVFARAGAVTYTQWEAWLADHLGKRLCCFVLEGRPNPAQQEHTTLLAEHKRYPKSVKNDEALYDETILTLIELGFLSEIEARRPIALPYPSLGMLFKGRDEFLTALRESLSAAAGEATAIVGKAVHGLGGVGKTRLAVEYAWKHVEDYSAVLFVTADSPENLRRNLAELVGPLVLNLPEFAATEEEVRFAAAVRWLQDHPGWFLILDNVDTEQAAERVEELLASLPGGHVLITSRLSRWSNYVLPLELDVLPPEAATTFLLERTAPKSGGRGRVPQPSDEVNAVDLARELDGLALALEQAAAYVIAQRISLGEYHRRWKAHEATVQQWHSQREMKAPRSVAVTWQTTLDQLSVSAVALLNVLAWFAPEPIPSYVIEATDDVEQSTVIGLPTSSVIREVLGELADFSMIRWEAAAETVTVHRVVQEILRSRQTQPVDFLTSALRLLEHAIPPGDPCDVRTWLAWDALRSHFEFASAEADRRKIADPTSCLMNALGVLLLAKALYSAAEPLMRRALAIDEASYGPNHPNVAINLNNVAQALQATNRLTEAEPLMRRALTIDEESYGPDYPKVATDLNNLAQLLQATNRLAEAEPLMRRALTIDEESYGPDHPKFATDLNNLAQLLQTTNRLAEAEPLMRRALTIDEESYGPDHPKVAIRLNNLAMLLKATNSLAEAAPLMRRALTIDEESYGPDHPKVATDLNNLAQLLKATNRLAEAEPLMRRALKIDEESYGPDHPKVATDLNNLAQLLKATNRLAEAEPLMRRALAVDETSYGPGHPEVARDLNNLAQLLQATNRLAEAEPLMHRALAVDETSYGTDHPDVALDLNNLALLLKDSKRLAEAEPLMQRAVEIFQNFRETTGHEHPNWKAVQQNYANLQKASQKRISRWWRWR